MRFVIATRSDGWQYDERARAQCYGTERLLRWEPS